MTYWIVIEMLKYDFVDNKYKCESVSIFQAPAVWIALEKHCIEFCVACLFGQGVHIESFENHCSLNFFFLSIFCRYLLLHRKVSTHQVVQRYKVNLLCAYFTSFKIAKITFRLWVTVDKTHMLLNQFSFDWPC